MFLYTEIRNELGVNDMLIDIKDRIDEIAIKELIAYSVFPDPDSLEKTVNEYKTNDNLELFGLEENHEVIGVVGIKQDNKTIEIRHIVVHPQFRGIGYGRGQLLELIEMKRPEEIFAETDGIAVEFYRNVGFSINSLGEKYPGVERFKCVYWT
jgi:N-acetylglutamate synthase-like GNAT family acetyltransferase